MGLLQKSPERKVCRYRAIDRELFFQKLAHKCRMDIDDLDNYVRFTDRKEDELRDLKEIVFVKVYRDCDDVYDVVKLKKDEVLKLLEDEYEKKGFRVDNLYLNVENYEEVQNGDEEDYETDKKIHLKMQRDKFIFPQDRKTLVAYATALFMFVAPFVALFGLPV